MGLLGDIFDDVVEIASTPLKLGSSLFDGMTDMETRQWVDNLKNSLKTKDYSKEELELLLKLIEKAEEK